MALPLKYSFRNVVVRWRSTIATIAGVAMTVLVYIVMQMMAEGLESAGGSTGDPRNMIIVRRGADSESSSQITREDMNVIQYSEEIARDAQDRPLFTADTLVVVYLPRAGDAAQGGANVIFRGVSPNGPTLRPQVKLVEGRMFSPGNREIIVSRRLARRFENMGVGATVKIGARELKIAGHFDAGGSAFDSEAWLDADEARAVFSRANYCSILARPKNAAAATALKQRLESDKRLSVRTVSEKEYYAEQTKTAEPIRYTGTLLAAAMSIGAVFAAMNTMYASVGARTRELGTLRVLGFRRGAITAAVLLEGGFLASLGGALACALILPLNGYSVGTFNFQTFGEAVFSMKLTPQIAVKALVFSTIVGVIGSLLPAWRAARMPVIAALKSI